MLGIRVISIAIKNDPENDPENISYKEELIVGEFKDGKLHGLGRKYTDSWYFDEGTWEEDKLKEGELTFNYECDDYRCTLMLHTDNEAEEQLRIIYGTLDRPNYYEMAVYKNKLKDGVFLSYYKDGTIYNTDRYEKDNQMDSEQKPTHEEAEAVINKHLKDPKNKKLLDWYESGKDIREYIGAPRNPIFYIDLLANKFKIGEEILPYKAYYVHDVTAETQEDDDESNKYIMYYFDEKRDWEMVQDFYKKYTCPKYINKMVEIGQYDIMSVEEKTIYFIIVEKPRNTLREVINKQTKIEQISKLNFIINILKEFDKITRLGYSLNNISPDSIVLSDSKDEFYFTSFFNITKFMMK